jgi:hypothetical protein
MFRRYSVFLGTKTYLIWSLPNVYWMTKSLGRRQICLLPLNDEHCFAPIPVFMLTVPEALIEAVARVAPASIAASNCALLMLLQAVEGDPGGE